MSSNGCHRRGCCAEEMDPAQDGPPLPSPQTGPIVAGVRGEKGGRATLRSDKDRGGTTCSSSTLILNPDFKHTAMGASSPRLNGGREIFSLGSLILFRACAIVLARVPNGRSEIGPVTDT